MMTEEQRKTLKLSMGWKTIIVDLAKVTRVEAGSVWTVVTFHSVEYKVATPPQWKLDALNEAVGVNGRKEADDAVRDPWDPAEDAGEVRLVTPEEADGGGAESL